MLSYCRVIHTIGAIFLFIIFCNISHSYDSIPPIDFGSAQVDNSSPLIADIRSDIAGKEILVGCLDGFLYCFDCKGNQVFKFDCKVGIDSSPAVADINLDGVPEIIVGAGSLDTISSRNNNGGIYVINNYGQEIWSYHGTPVKPYGVFGSAALPFSIPESLDYVVNDGFAEYMESTPAVANVDSDPQPEIFIGCLDHSFYAFNYDGTLLESLNDDDGDGLINEDPGFIRAGSEGIDDDGDSHAGALDGCNTIWGACIDEDPPDWPIDNQDTVFSSAGVGDIDGDGYKEIIFGGDSTQIPSGGSFCDNGGKLWFLRAGGTSGRKNNYPLPIGSRKLPDGDILCKGQIFASSPALADIDGNGKNEIFIGTGNYAAYLSNPDTNRVFAFDYLGNELPGWPYNCGANQWTKSSPAIGDVNGDGVLDIVICSGDYSGSSSKIHAINSKTGQSLPGFPISPINQPIVISSPIIADVNGDDKADIIFGMNNRVFAYDGSGNQIMHIQCLSFMPFQNALAADDIDNDGNIEIVACLGNLNSPSTGGLFIIKAGLFNPSTMYWSMFRGNPSRDGLYKPPLSFVRISGTAAANTEIKFVSSGGTLLKSITSDSDGNYSFGSVPFGWSGTVTPIKTGYNFNPASRTFTNLSEDFENQNFTPNIFKYTISGYTIPETELKFITDGGIILGSVSSDSNGFYQFNEAYYDWSGVSIPAKNGFSFTPSYYSYNSVRQDFQQQNFDADVDDSIYISGWASSGSQIEFLSADKITINTITADQKGFYINTRIPKQWSGEIFPVKSGLIFTPEFITCAALTENVLNQNFTSAESNNIQISGWALPETFFTFISDGNIYLGSTKASSNGFFSFSQIPQGWSGKIVPSLFPYIFTPQEKIYTQIYADLNNQNFTAEIYKYQISGWAVSDTIVEYKNTDGSTLASVNTNTFGLYEFKQVPHGWSGTITPSNLNYIFQPLYRQYDNITTDYYDQNFVAFSKEFTIAGSSAIGALIDFKTVDGPVIASVVADNFGNYSYDKVPYGWSGTVTPSHNNYIFLPANRKYVNLTENRYNENFTPVSNEISIGGNAAPLASIEYKNADNTILHTAAADSNGDYIYQSVPYGWSGTLTPRSPNYIFEPVSRTYTNIVLDMLSENFTETRSSYKIAGTAITNTIIKFKKSDGTETASIQTDSLGQYEYNNIPLGWSGKAIPQKSGFSFTPLFIEFTNVSDDFINQNFIAKSGALVISGITVANAKVTFETDNAGILAEINANDSGYYICDQIPEGWNGTVTPFKPGYIFLPVNRYYYNLSESRIDQNFTGYPANIEISGTTLANTAISFINKDGTSLTEVVSDANGNYSYEKIPIGWSGTIIPYKIGFSFSPYERTYNNLITNLEEQDFPGISSVIKIDGWTLSDAELSFTSESGVLLASVRADSNGYYSYSQAPYGWSGKVKPFKYGYSFTPRERQYTKLYENQQGQNFTGTPDFREISGWAAADVKITFRDLSDNFFAEVQADSQGFYSFTRVPNNWSGTVTPSKDNKFFVPEYRIYNNIESNYMNQNFSVYDDFYSIAGWALEETKLTFETDGGNILTEISTEPAGSYIYNKVPYGWSGKVIPSLDGYIFTPSYMAFYKISSNQYNQNFSWTTNELTISGQAAPYASVAFTSSDGTDIAYIDCDAGGYFLYEHVPFKWSGTITPFKQGYKFTPDKLVFDSINRDQHNQNFSAEPGKISISGWTQPDTVIKFDSKNGTILSSFFSDTFGFYRYDDVPYAWSGKIIPSKPGYNFSPGYLEYNLIKTNLFDQNFSYEQIFFTISGWALGGTKIQFYTSNGAFTGETYSGINGFYSFDKIPYEWSGTATPEKAGYLFTPDKQYFSSVNKNFAEQNFLHKGKQLSISGYAPPYNTINFINADGKTLITVMTDGTGYYSYSNVPYNWSGTVKPVKLLGYRYNIDKIEFSGITSNQENQNFIYEKIDLTISGWVLPDTSVLFANANKSILTEATADSSGFYSYSQIPFGWSGTVKPVKIGYSFFPPYKGYKNLEINMPDQNFIYSNNTGTADSWTLY